MSRTSIIPVILSGGSGTRLWPLSTPERPKQFHSLGAAQTMIAETALRLSGDHGAFGFLAPIVIAGEAHRDLVCSQLADVGIAPSAIVLEPEGRNTAASAALAALAARQVDKEALVLLAPADHLVRRPQALMETVSRALEVTDRRIVTFGIAPTGPETGYGYILQAEELAPGVHQLAEFREKPDRVLAEAYIRDPRYSWNSGMFLFAPELLLAEFARHAEDILAGTARAFEQAERRDGTILLEASVFAAVRSEAVDRAVMEKTDLGAVAPCDIGWADVGSWAELWRLSRKDADGNALSGSVLTLDARDNLVRAEGVHVSLVGVSDLIVVVRGQSVLVMPRERAQDVKKVIPDQA